MFNKKYKSFTFKSKNGSHEFLVYVEEKNFEVNRQKFVDFVNDSGSLHWDYISAASDYSGDWAKYEIRFDEELINVAKINAAYVWVNEGDEDEC